MIIEGIEVQNPLLKAAPVKARMTHDAPGVSLEVFRHTLKNLSSLLKEGGYERIISVGQTNYLVLKLYQKIVGMKPLDESSAKTIEMLDFYYKFARTKLPQVATPRNLDDFSRFTGMVDSRVNGAFHHQTWVKFQLSGKLPRNVQILRSEDGQVIGLLFQGRGRRAHVAFVDRLDPEMPLLEWNSLMKAGRVRLTLDLQ